MQTATVYLVTNTQNNHTYVGVTRKSVNQRWKNHVYIAKTRPVTYFHRAIAKYGAGTFCVEPVASCLSESIAAVERDVIAWLRPTYNQTNGGEATVGRRIAPEVAQKIADANRGKKRTPEQRAAMSITKRDQFMSIPGLREAAVNRIIAARALVDETKRIERARVACASRVWTDESRAKLSASSTGRHYGPEVAEKIAAKKRKAVQCVESGVVYRSVSDASLATGISISGISKVCLGKRSRVHDLTFKFV